MFRPLDADVLRDPYPTYHQLRARGRAVWFEQLGVWLIPGYRDCVAVYRDPERFGVDRRKLSREVLPSAVNVQSLDPPEHTAVRNAIAAAYRAQSVTELERFAEQRADDLLQAVRDHDVVDIMTQFAAPLALSSICEFLGTAPPTNPEFFADSDAIVQGMDAGLRPERAAPGRAAAARLSALVAQWLATSIQRGMLGALTRSRPDSAVAPEALHNSVRVVFHAGYTSVYSALGSAIHALLRRLGDWSILRDEAMRDRAIDEAFRIDGPVQVNSRVCYAPVEIGDATIARGDTVLLLLGAANRDPEQFADPDQLRLDRDPNPHLAFGWGIHSCIGGGLARAIVRAGLTRLAGLPALRLADEVTYKPQATQRCLHHLPVALGWA